MLLKLLVNWFKPLLNLFTRFLKERKKSYFQLSFLFFFFWFVFMCIESCSVLLIIYIYYDVDRFVVDFIICREGMATHTSVLAWRISWTEEPDGLQSVDPVQLLVTPWTGILQARILQWVTIAISRRSSEPRSPTMQADSLSSEPPRSPFMCIR